MKKNPKNIFYIFLLVMFILSVFSCGISTEELAKQVQEGIIEHYKENDVKIIFTRNLILTHKSGNEYTGGADVTLDGEQMRISLDVISDGKSYQAEWSLTYR